MSFLKLDAEGVHFPKYVIGRSLGEQSNETREPNNKFHHDFSPFTGLSPLMFD